MIHARGYANIQKLIKDAVEQGAQLVCGGEALAGEGYFMQPTVLKDVPLAAECMHKEPFYH